MNLADKLSRVFSACILISLLALCGCRGLVDGTTTPTPPVGDLKALNHIIFMAQENRSFDTYFGQLPAYWAANGYPAQPSFNGIPVGASNPTFTIFALSQRGAERMASQWGTLTN